MTADQQIGATTDEQIREVARRVFLEMWNEQKHEVIEEVFSPNVVWHSPIQPEPIRGHAGVREFVTRIHTGFPDFHTTIEDQLVQGDKTAIRFHVRATHTGPYLGIPPTGRRITTTQIVINQVVDGQIVNVWQEINAMLLLQQMGAIPRQGVGPVGLIVWAFGTVFRFGRLQMRYQRQQARASQAGTPRR